MGEQRLRERGGVCSGCVTEGACVEDQRRRQRGGVWDERGVCGVLLVRGEGVCERAAAA